MYPGRQTVHAWGVLQLLHPGSHLLFPEELPLLELELGDLLELPLDFELLDFGGVLFEPLDLALPLLPELAELILVTIVKRITITNTNFFKFMI